MNFIKKDKIYYLVVIIVSLIFFSNLESNPDKHTSKWEGQFFDADVYRVAENLKNSKTLPQSENNIHPFFPLVAVSIAKVPSYLGIENSEFNFYKIFFGTISFFMFWFFLYKETTLLISFASLILLMSTMTVRIWSTIPETFLFGFFTIMLSLLLIRANVKPIYVMLSSFGGTITNVLFGFIYLLFKEKKLDKILKILISAAFAVVAISLIQKNIYTSATHFFDPSRIFNDVSHINFDILKLPYKLFDFFISGFVIPITPKSTYPLDTYQIWGQFFLLENGNRVTLATFLSIFLLTFLIMRSLIYYFKLKKNFSMRIILYFLIFQLVLHSIFGYTPFLYSYHFIPLLIIFFAKVNFQSNFKYLSYTIIILAVLIQDVNIFHYGGTFNNLFIK